jgi:formate dehydrogenase accessory protein FdhE
MRNGKWDARVRRASELATRYPFAARVLTFYAQIATFQKSLYSELERELGTETAFRKLGTLRERLDLVILAPKFLPFLSHVERHAPAELARFAAELRNAGTARAQDVLGRSWEVCEGAGELSESDSVLAWMFLQPYAEYLADHADHTPIEGTPSLCPMCASKPVTGVLRPEGDGGKRLLLCSLCGTEWNFRRIVCPSCGEEDVERLAVYSTEKFPCVRVEACDSCRHYLKTVDLTKDGHAVPAVDELASLPMNLWAVENGYRKLHPNILGL